MTKSKKQFAPEQTQTQTQAQPQAQAQSQAHAQTQTQTKTKAKPKSQTKSQSQGKQYAQQQGQPQNQMNQMNPMQPQGSTEEFNRSVELAFGDHPWPADRSELLEYASRQGTFAKSDLARLKRIPHREYHSVKDLVNATREADMAMTQPGPVTTAENNRRAMGEAPEPVRTHSADRYDEPIH